MNAMWMQGGLTCSASSTGSSNELVGGALRAFVERLLATNCSQTNDARAAAVQRVLDKTIQLDNPVKVAGANTQAGLVR